jgi:hypothetical protein
MGVKANPVALILFSHIPPYLESSRGSGICPKTEEGNNLGPDVGACIPV